MKRIFDLFIALLLIVVLFLPIIVISILIYFKLGRPIIFKQQRPGKNGKLFWMYKFRTMTNECDKDGKLLKNEDRITDFGRFLRKTSIDEFPELFNVIIGQMSLVGPRPLRKEYLPYYNDFQNRRHEVLPGITGYAQINGRNAISWDKRFELDVYYVDNRTIMMDFNILFKTFFKVIKKENIGQSEEKEFIEPFVNLD